MIRYSYCYPVSLAYGVCSGVVFTLVHEASDPWFNLWHIFFLLLASIENVFFSHTMYGGVPN